FFLSGLSEIHRCAKTAVDDGESVPVKLVPGDGYCLDGQRLKRTGGTYGQNGSTYGTSIEIFASIQALGSLGAGPSSWKVFRKDGTIWTYGATADSQITAAGSGLRWMVNE